MQRSPLGRGLLGGTPRAPRRMAAPLLVAAVTLPALSGCSGSVKTIVDGDPVIRVVRRDAIPSIDRPRMLSVGDASQRMRDDEPVLGVVRDGAARAYPLWYLESHEIVNDTLGDLPIAATW